MVSSTDDPQTKSSVITFLLQHAEVAGDPLRVTIPRGHAELDAALSELDDSEQARDNEKHVLEGVSCFDMLGAYLESVEARALLETSLGRAYLDYAQRLPMKAPGSFSTIQVQLLSMDAVVPQKSRPSDSGFDLTLISLKKQVGAVTLYGTGIVVQPPEGYYFDVVPRSSIIKSGYMLANQVGVIDRAYRGELMVPLIKIDKNAPDIVLPARLVQMIPRPIVHFPIEAVSRLTTTSRGAGGFGSTGQ